MQDEALLGKLGVRMSLRRLVALLVAYMVAHLCYGVLLALRQRGAARCHERSRIKVIHSFICCVTFMFPGFAIATKLDLDSHKGVSKAFGSTVAMTPDICTFHFSTVGFSFVCANRLRRPGWSAKGFFAFCLVDTVPPLAVSLVIKLMRQRLMDVIGSRQEKLTKGVRGESLNQTPLP